MDTQFVDFLTESVYIDGENLASILSQALGITLSKTQAQTFASAVLSSTTSGDVDNNGKRTKEDIDAIIQYLHGKLQLTDEQKNVADITGDDTIRINDIVAIQKLIAEGIIPYTPTPSPSPTYTVTPSVTPTMTITTTETLEYDFAPIENGDTAERRFAKSTHATDVLINVRVGTNQTLKLNAQRAHEPRAKP